jgi:hypothetical protein
VRWLLALSWVVLCWTPVQAGITYVQLKEISATANSNSISTPNFDSAVSNGSLMVCWMFYDSIGGQFVQNVTDTKSNRYVKGTGPSSHGDTGTTWKHEVWYSANIAGGASFNATATFNATFNAEKNISCHEYQGVAPSDPLDITLVADAVASSGGVGTSPSFTTTAANALIFAVNLCYSATGGPGFNMRSNMNANVSEDKIAVTPGSYAASFTSGGWSGIQVLVFKPAYSAGVLINNPM